MPRKMLLIAAALVALAIPATADARYTASRVATAHVAIGSRTAFMASTLVRARQAGPADCPNADVVPTPGNLDAVRAAILCLHNQIRARNGLSQLKSNPKLRHAAEGHSADMVQAHYFQHTTPRGDTMVDRILASRYVRADQGWLMGENLEWGTGSMATPRGAMDAWMNSPDHRANILKRGYRDVGVGVSLGVPNGGDTGVTITVDFGARR